MKRGGFVDAMPILTSAARLPCNKGKGIQVLGMVGRVEGEASEGDGWQRE
jgi:hypothetical protein